MLRLTEAGLSVYDELVPISYDYEQQLLTCFSDAESKQFSKLIDRLYEYSGK